MSIFYHTSFASPVADSASTYCLWSDDPYLSSKLLAAIASEASNRHLPVYSYYDPLMPSIPVGLQVDSIGKFTTSPNSLSRGAQLIDATVIAKQAARPWEQLQSIAQEKERLAERIGKLGDCLKAQTDLCQSLSAPMVMSKELTQKAIRIAQKVKGRCGKQTVVPIFSYQGADEVYRLPFGKEVEIISIEGHYHLPELFLDALLSALERRSCECVRLEDALTHESVGVWLPDDGRCYLLRAPDELCHGKRSLSRYLAPHTQIHRHNHRSLQAACKGWQDRLILTVGEYQSLCAKEEALYAPLYENDRLQSFRKRLLIDLFC